MVTSDWLVALLAVVWLKAFWPMKKPKTVPAAWWWESWVFLVVGALAALVYLGLRLAGARTW